MPAQTHQEEFDLPVINSSPEIKPQPKKRRASNKNTDDNASTTMSAGKGVSIKKHRNAGRLAG